MEEWRMLSTCLVLVVVMSSFSACAVMEGNSIPPNVVQQECEEKPYRHKSKEQLSLMSPNQLIAESVKEQMYHPAGSWNRENHDDSYVSMFGKYLNRFDPESILPVLVPHIDSYAPQNASRCKEIGFLVASGTLGDLDNSRIRIRAIPEGQRVIDALEKSVNRLKDAGFDSTKHERHYLYNLAAHNLEMAKATNIRDEMIRASLQAREKVQMSQSEYLDFSDFLTSVDPYYPTWSDVAESGPPALVKDTGRYFEAYKRFKAGKAPE